MTATELASVLGTSEEPLLLDVREPDEVSAWSIPGVVNIPLGDLAGGPGRLPSDRLVVTVCASGNRSTMAARVLAAHGFEVANLSGGMSAWGQVYDVAPLEVADARIVQVRRRGKGCLSYVVGHRDEAFVVDPSVDAHVYRQVAEDHGWRITRVFDTHLHADHVSGARGLAEEVGAELHLNPTDTFEFAHVALGDGDRFELAGGATMSASVTPGHTEGSTVFQVGDHALLSGDTLFVDGVGRPDLAEKAEPFARNLHRSLREKVLTLPDHVQVLPAHYGPNVLVRPDEPVAASLGELRASLAPLSLDEDAFVEWAVARVGERPPNYVQIVTANMGRFVPSRHGAAQLEAGPNRCSA